MNVIEEFKKNLDEMKDKLEPILKGDTGKFIQIAANYVEQNPGLLEKNKQSLYASIIKAAQSGLYIDGQESALVPFKGQVTFMPMYKGLLKQVRNSGELSSINCGVVYECDGFDFYVDENGEHLKHVPDFDPKKRGIRTGTYAIARIKGGQAPYIEIMTEEEIQSCKKSAYIGKDSPWNGPFADEMRKKTVLRRISKRLPMSTDLNAAIHADDDLFIPPDEAQDPPEEKTTSAGLHDAVTPETVEPEKQPEYKNHVEGVIEEARIFPATIKGKKVDRYGAKIQGVWYGTFEKKLYEEMQKNQADKSTVWLFFEKKERPSDGKEINEAVDIKVIETPTEDVPI